MRPWCLFSSLALPALTGCAGKTSDLVAPNFELVNEDQRLDAKLINAHTYGTFVISVPDVVIRSGPANFPGNPPGGPGTCVDGKWYNSKGKPTAGSLTHPHPHCVADAVSVVLEPISSRVHDPLQKCEANAPCDFLEFGNIKTPDFDVLTFVKSKKDPVLGTEGTGTVFAYAIDAATVGTTNARVGTISFDLSQYDDPTTNLFGSCDLDDLGVVACLPRVIVGTYQPLAGSGVGSVTQVTGFLWWSPATSPYNY
jgi:hypothetical protein